MEKHWKVEIFLNREMTPAIYMTIRSRDAVLPAIFLERLLHGMHDGEVSQVTSINIHRLPLEEGSS